MPKIKILKDKTVYNGQYIKTIVRTYRGRTGKIRNWEMVERKAFRKIVAIAPLTAKKEIIFTKTYRIPLKRYVIELCAGLADKGNETEEKVAKRELLEETGYTVSKMKKFTVGPFSSGLADTRMSIYLDFDARKITKQNLEESEDIKVIKVPLSKAYKLLSNPPKNTLVDIKIFSVLLAYKMLGYKV